MKLFIVILLNNYAPMFKTRENIPKFHHITEKSSIYTKLDRFSKNTTGYSICIINSSRENNQKIRKKSTKSRFFAFLIKYFSCLTIVLY